MDDFRTVLPNQLMLPRRIVRLGELAYNLWWTWNPDAQRLFARIDPILWKKPITMLSVFYSSWIKLH